MPRGPIRPGRKRRSTVRKEDQLAPWPAGSFPVDRPGAAAAILSSHLADRFSLIYEDGKLLGPPGEKASVLKDAADQLEMSYTTLHRLAHGRALTVSWHHMLLLQEHLPSAVWHRFRAQLICRAGRHALDEYRAYIDREKMRLRTKRSRKHNAYLFGEVRAVADRFGSRMKKRGVPGSRADLAIYRAFDRLVGYRRLWRRLRQTNELVEFLRDSLAHEERLIEVELEELHAAFA